MYILSLSAFSFDVVLATDYKMFITKKVTSVSIASISAANGYLGFNASLASTSISFMAEV